jgi:mannosyltransferase OCH1-like enzyme
METWREVMPGYAIERWDESRLPRDAAYPNIAYRERRFAFVADYVRLRALYDHGGLYFDTDIEALLPFDPLLDVPLFLGLQAPDSIGVGVIGAVKGHPFLKLALDRLDAEASAGRPRFQPLPELVTALARTAAPGPTVFPEDYFYPYNPHSPSPLRQKPLQSNMSERTFCIHHWEGTWLGGMSLSMMIGLRVKHRLQRAGAACRRLLAPGAIEAGP